MVVTMETTTDITIGGMLAVHAARAVFTALSGVDGIHSADVSLGRAVVRHDGRVTHDQLSAAIALAGFEVLEIRDEKRLPLL